VKPAIQSTVMKFTQNIAFITYIKVLAVHRNSIHIHIFSVHIHNHIHNDVYTNAMPDIVQTRTSIKDVRGNSRWCYSDRHNKGGILQLYFYDYGICIQFHTDPVLWRWTVTKGTSSKEWNLPWCPVLYLLIVKFILCLIYWVTDWLNGLRTAEHNTLSSPPPKKKRSTLASYNFYTHNNQFW